MSDMYLRPQRSNRGCLILVLVALAAAGAWGLWRWRNPRVASEPEPEPFPELQAPAETAAQPQPAAKPAPPAARPATGTVAAARTSDEGLALMAQARQLKSEDKLLESRDLAYRVLAQSSQRVAQQAAEALLGEINAELVLSPRMMPEKEEYVVQSGDSLDKLARRFKTTVDVIRKGNRITGSTIRVGDRLRLFKGQFSIEVSKTRNDLLLKLNDRFFKRYPVGTGEYGKTPVGDFKITQKIAQPTWWRPDGKSFPYGHPENVLGTHWLSLDIPGYGIHGTWQPETIGKQASAGCIRMLNESVEELFTLVPEGTPVRIAD